MASEKTMKMAVSYPMNGGNGRNSYAQNSTYQRNIVGAAKDLIIEAIKNNFEIENPPLDYCPNSIRIADFGCSTGLNTFTAAQNIIEAVDLKYQTKQQNVQKKPEFHVFFNDRTNNDFNTLFLSLPPSRNYFAAGVPGSFYCRLFPKATLHIAHSSNSLNWLSEIPEEMVDRSSPFWNKGRIHYRGSEKVFEAYSAQFKKDMGAFLSARAQEVVGGGLVLLVLSGCEDGVIPSETSVSMLLGLLGSCLMDMVKKGMVSEEKVDSFNVPSYQTSPKELKELIETNGNFNIERIEYFAPNVQDTHKVETVTAHIRAITEGLIIGHFGSDQFIDELFERYAKKVGENMFIFDKEHRKGHNIFASLKRKVTD